MLVNAIVTRFTTPLVAFCLALTLGNVPRGSAQSTLPPMPGADAPIIDYQNRFLPAYGRLGMVVSPEALASEIGLDMLKQGGNAIDAAVATGSPLP